MRTIYTMTVCDRSAEEHKLEEVECGTEEEFNALSEFFLNCGGDEYVVVRSGPRDVMYFHKLVGQEFVARVPDELKRRERKAKAKKRRAEAALTDPEQPPSLIHGVRHGTDAGLEAPVHERVAGEAPRANAGPDQTVAGHSLVQLAGSGSDPRGLGLTYTWTQIAGPAVSLSNAKDPEATFAEPDGLANTKVTFQLRVSDGTDSSVDTTTVTIDLDEEAPRAKAGPDQVVIENALVTLAGSSVDPMGRGLTYTWGQTSGPIVSLSDRHDPNARFTVPELIRDATITFELQVSDGANTSVDTVEFLIDGDSDTFTANAGLDQSVEGNELVVLDGSAASDGAFEALGCSWAQTGGPQVVLSDPSAARSTFTAPGGLTNTTLTFELTILDGRDARRVLSLSPLSYWRLGESSSTTAQDQSGGHDGTFTVDPTLGPRGADGPCQVAVFDGMDDYVEIPHHDDFLLDAGSIQVWFNASTVSGRHELVSKASAGWDTGGHLTASVRDGQVEFELQSTLSTNSVVFGPVAAGEWHQAVFSFGSRGMMLYIDGALVDTNLYTGGLSTTSGSVGNYEPLVIGASTAHSGERVADHLQDFFDGMIQEVAVFAGQLGDQDVLDLYNSGTRVRSRSVDAVEITVEADPEVLEADAGPDQRVVAYDRVGLDASGSKNPARRALRYAWTQTAGPSVTLSNANTVSPTLAVPDVSSDTTATFQVELSDGVQRSIDTVRIEIGPCHDSSAWAEVDLSKDECDVERDVVSPDPEDQELTYTWTQTSGPTVVLSDPNAISPAFTAPEGLTNTNITFEVSISDGTTTFVDTVAFTVNSDDNAPGSNAGPHQVVDDTDLVILTGSGTDPRGRGLTYEWVQVSGTPVALDDWDTTTPTFSAPRGVVNSDLAFELRVNDGINTSSDTVTITVLADEGAPAASAGHDLQVMAGDVVRLSGSSTDPGGCGPSYHWFQVSGPPTMLDDSRTASPSFAVPAGLVNSTIVFELQMSDGTCRSADTVTIEVGGDGPHADAGTDELIESAAVYSFAAKRRVDRQGEDPDSELHYYQWHQVGGPDGILEDAHTPAPTFTAPPVTSPCRVIIELVVSDGTKYSSDTKTLFVHPPEAQPSLAEPFEHEQSGWSRLEGWPRVGYNLQSIDDTPTAGEEPSDPEAGLIAGLWAKARAFLATPRGRQDPEKPSHPKRSV